MPMIESPGEQDLPVLRSSVRVERSGESVVVRHLSREVTLEGAAARLFDQMESQLDGKTAIDVIARSMAEKPARLRALAVRLGEAGVLAFLSTHGDDRPMSG